MKQTNKQNPIRLIRFEYDNYHIIEEVVWTFKDIQSIISYWPMLRLLNIGPKYRILTKSTLLKLNDVYRYYTHTLRDVFGDYVDINDIREQYHKQHSKKIIYKFRGIKRSSGHYYRRFRNLNERKQTENWKGEEFTPKPRARRNFKNLPDSWDDCPISSYENRNWKEFRKHQWKN